MFAALIRYKIIRNKYTENNPEDSFPSLLEELQTTLNCENVVSCGKSRYVEVTPSIGW